MPIKGSRSSSATVDVATRAAVAAAATLTAAEVAVRVVLVLRGAFIFFGWTVAAYGSVGG